MVQNQIRYVEDGDASPVDTEKSFTIVSETMIEQLAVVVLPDTDGEMEKKAKEIAERLKSSTSEEEKKRLKEMESKLEEAKGSLSEEGMKKLADEGVAKAEELAGGETRVGNSAPEAANTSGRTSGDTAEPQAKPIKATPPPAPENVVPAAVASAPDPEERKATKMGKGKGKETVITTGPDGYGLFDGNKKMAIFTDKTDAVILDSEDIYLTCEELEVHFKDDATMDGNEEAPAVEGEEAAPPAAAKGGATDDANSSIDVVYARGPRVFLQKKNTDGKIQIAQCRKATYEGETGDLILEIWPQIQENDNLVIATAEHTVIVIKRNGELRFRGPTETKLANKKN